jgi:hypothetical protein
MIKFNILSYFVRNITNSIEKKLYTQELIYNCFYIKYKGTDILYMYDFLYNIFIIIILIFYHIL